MAARLNVFKTSKKDCIFSQFIGWYIESDMKIKILTIWDHVAHQSGIWNLCCILQKTESKHILMCCLILFCRLSSLKSHFSSRPWYSQRSSMETGTVSTYLAITKALWQLGWRYSFFMYLKEIRENNFDTFNRYLN